MVDVRVRLTRPDVATGLDVGTTGSVEATPTRRRHIDAPDEDAVDRIILPSSSRETLVDGECTLVLDPTGPDWCWKIVERVPDGVVRYVVVPDVEAVDYGDLVDVDPATLDPAAEPEAAWWVALQDVAAGAVDPAIVQAAVDAALDGRLSSGGSVHLGEGPPPELIVGARVGDIYIDTIDGTIYQLGA